MRMKMETANKVMNIVEGNQAQLTELYKPAMMALQSEERLTLTGDSLRFNPGSLQWYFDKVPAELKKGMKHSVVQLSLEEIQEDLQANLETKMFYTSFDMLCAGLYSTNPVKGIPYLYQKFRKGRK